MVMYFLDRWTWYITIVYNKLSNESIVAHSNSDWAQDPESHKFMTGYFTLMAHEITS